MTEIEREKQLKLMTNAKDVAEFRELLREYIIRRLGLPPETSENGIYYLVLYSVRIKMPDEDIATLESRLATVDCHQTSFIVSKKTLLMLEIERGLGLYITPEDAEYAEDISKYAEVLWRTLSNDR